MLQTVGDSLVRSRLSTGSVCNTGTAAAEAKYRNSDKYGDLFIDGYFFQPTAFEVQGAAGHSTSDFSE